MAMQAGGIVGSLASGALIGAFGPGWQYVVVGVSYIAATVVLLGTGPIVESVMARRESILSNLAGYVRIIRENRILLVLMFLASITEILGFTHMTLLPVFAKEVLFVGPVGLGVMTAVRQGGGFIGLTLLASLSDYRRKGRLMFVIAGAFGLGLMAFSLSSNLFFFLAVLAFVNACAMAVDTLYKILMQENVAEEERGRAMGSWVLSIGTAPVGHLGVGGLAGVLGAPGALLVNGGVLAFVSLCAAIGLPRLRRLP
jgi:predicted MFS family arabinose efflux permease